MYRVDPKDEYGKHNGFCFPPDTTCYFTGSGGLHFYANLEDALAYASETCTSYLYATPLVQIDVDLLWSRELMEQQNKHSQATLVRGVAYYGTKRVSRDEIVIPGQAGSVFQPECLFKITLRTVSKADVTLTDADTQGT